MSAPDSELRAGLVQRFEEIVRDNERLQVEVARLNDRLADVGLAVGHVMPLLRLATAVEAYRSAGSADARAAMFNALDAARPHTG